MLSGESKPSTSKPLSKDSPRSHKSRREGQERIKYEKGLEVHPLVLHNGVPKSKDLEDIQDTYARALDLNNRLRTGTDFAVYLTQATKKLLNGRFVLFIGDSVVRAMYKDLVHLCHVESLVYPFDLQDKGERRFEGDTLLKGFKVDGRGARNGIDFEEIRILLKEQRSSPEKTLLSYMFCTRFYNDNVHESMRDIFFDVGNKFGFPDIVLVNSGLWDLSRYGKWKGHDLKSLMDEYRSNVEEFMDLFFKLSKGKSHLVVMSTLPVAKHCAGAFLSDDVNTETRNNLWKLVINGNEVLLEVVKKYMNQKYRISYLDLHALATNLDISQWWMPDGTHWHSPAHRLFTYSILSTIARISKQHLPNEQLKHFYDACDDVLRFDIFMKWMVCHHLQQRNLTMEELVSIWERKRTGGDTDEHSAQKCSREHPDRNMEPPENSLISRHEILKNTISGEERKHESRKFKKSSPRLFKDSKTKDSDSSSMDSPLGFKIQTANSVFSVFSEKTGTKEHSPRERQYSSGSSFPVILDESEMIRSSASSGAQHDKFQPFIANIASGSSPYVNDTCRTLLPNLPLTQNRFYYTQNGAGYNSAIGSLDIGSLSHNGLYDILPPAPSPSIEF